MCRRRRSTFLIGSHSASPPPTRPNRTELRPSPTRPIRTTRPVRTPPTRRPTNQTQQNQTQQNQTQQNQNQQNQHQQPTSRRTRMSRCRRTTTRSHPLSPSCLTNSCSEPPEPADVPVEEASELVEPVWLRGVRGELLLVGRELCVGRVDRGLQSGRIEGGQRLPGRHAVADRHAHRRHGAGHREGRIGSIYRADRSHRRLHLFDGTVVATAVR